MQTALEAINSAPVALKTAPPVAVSTLSLAGVGIQEWVYAATLVWILLQIAGWCWDRYSKYRQARDLAHAIDLDSENG